MIKEPTLEEIGKVYSFIFAKDHPYANVPIHDIWRIVDLIQYPTESGIMEAFRKMCSVSDFAGMRKAAKWLQLEQDEIELGKMLPIIKGSKSLLEVGSRFGGNLEKMSSMLAPNSRVVSVDAPINDEKPFPHKPKECLAKVASTLKAAGHDCILIDADSQRPDTVKRVARLAPFDFGFIDADHSYEGVKKDWENYGPMCKVVGFHDIAGVDAGCVQFWNELKGSYRHEEFINHSRTPDKLGIGIIYREE